MSRKKGLSFEEKRSRMLDFFHEKKDVFQLKELEKLCYKEKGITSMSVKEVLQSLVDDNLVDTDKIGTSIYFWALPSNAIHSRKRRLQRLEIELKETTNRQRDVNTKLSAAKKERKDTEQRRKVLSELKKLKTDQQELDRQLNQYSSCDPDVIEKYRVETETAKQAVNRWTDNIFAIRSWMKNRLCVSETEINQQFNIPEDLDYIE